MCQHRSRACIHDGSGAQTQLHREARTNTDTGQDAPPCARSAATRVPRASQETWDVHDTEHGARDSGTDMYLRSRARQVHVCSARCADVCVSANDPAAVSQVKAILKVRFRFVSREFVPCECWPSPGICLCEREGKGQHHLYVTIIRGYNLSNE